MYARGPPFLGLPMSSLAALPVVSGSGLDVTHLKSSAVTDVGSPSTTQRGQDREA